jgi:hypothetical protein
LKEVLQHINSKVSELNFFNKQIELAEKIEREGAFFPAIYNSKGEYDRIDLDKSGSLSYWRKNGDVTMSSQGSESTIGQEFRKDIPLKFVGYLKKEESSDQYFADAVIDSIISVVTTSNSDVKKLLKAKRVFIVATKSVTDKIEVEKAEYETKVDTIRYQDCYFSIDFTLSIFTNSQCYRSICTDC